MLTMQVVVDRSVLEVFLDGGVKTGTSVFFTEGELDVLSLAVGGLSEGAMVTAEVWGLGSGWQSEMMPGGNGTQSISRRW